MKKIMVEVVIKKNGGIIAVDDLEKLKGKILYYIEKSIGWNNIFILSGRLPVWAYSYLTHVLHPAKVVGCFEPRSNCAIIVMSHAPEVREGMTITIEDTENL